MAVTIHLLLWWPYIFGSPSLNLGNAAINAIENALGRPCNRNFGDAEVVICTLKCQNIMCEGCDRRYVLICSKVPSIEKY